MHIQMVLLLVCVACTIVGAWGTAWQIYQLTIIDARARGLKHPRFWGLVAANANNSSGLLLYLLGRRRHPYVDLTKEDQEQLALRKHKAQICLVFLVVSAILTVLCLVFVMPPELIK